jgi:hypothetical protein
MDQSKMAEAIFGSVGTSLFVISKEKDPEKRKALIKKKQEADAALRNLTTDLAKKYGR